ncbi:DUF1661 domain-containing protein [Porphyromonas gulae]|uniref:DUF1661 domain-containing protein n=1 Tax=Porphyromonas gulae TaxID=111105 RepID=UPI0012D470C7
MEILVRETSLSTSPKTWCEKIFLLVREVKKLCATTKKISRVSFKRSGSCFFGFFARKIRKAGSDRKLFRAVFLPPPNTALYIPFHPYAHVHVSDSGRLCRDRGHRI